MWLDDTFSQRNKTTKRAWGIRQNLRKGVKQYRGELGTLCQLCSILAKVTLCKGLVKYYVNQFSKYSIIPLYANDQCFTLTTITNFSLGN